MRGAGRISLILFTLLLTTVSAESLAVDPATISYDLTAFGGGRWRYDYDVTNVSLADPIREFTIWFDHSLYQDLVLATPDPLAADWSELVVQPAPSLHDDGFYDALKMSGGITAGAHVGGFAVEFDWLGAGLPG
ncbi:MAG: hypothetical protein HY718_21825, partial [Planctomycetes bacterium]|nr:hypothetical protein [Planctomycetota bacterium]